MATAASPRSLRPSRSPSPDQDVNDRQERLTALVHVLGFPSLDDLEDFVFLHGAARVVPLAQRDTLPLEETQTQAPAAAAAATAATADINDRHARRHQERRVENAQLRRDLAQAQQALEWTRNELAKSKETSEGLVKDKQRLLDLVESLKRAPAPRANAPSGSSASSQAGMPIDVELANCWDEISALEASNAALEEELRRVQSERDERAAEVEAHRIGREEEMRRADAAEAAHDELKSKLSSLLGDGDKTSSSKRSAAGPASPAARLDFFGPSSRAERASPSERRASSTFAPNSSATVIAQPLRSPSGSDVATPTPAVPAPPLPTAIAAAPSATQRTGPALVHPRVVAISSVPPSISTSPSSATTTSVSQTKAREQVNLYPRLLDSYRAQLRTLDDRLDQLCTHDEFVAGLDPARASALRTQLGPRPHVDEDELRRLRDDAAYPSQLPATAEARKAFARSGELPRLYAELEQKESELGQLNERLKQWMKRATKACKQLFSEGTGGEANGTPQAGEAAGKKRAASAAKFEAMVAQSAAAAQAPSSTARQPVKKRRRVSKDGSETPAPIVALKLEHAQPLPSAARHATPTPAALVSPRKAASPSKAGGGVGSTPPRLGSSPRTSSKKKRWNLHSPTKRSGIKSPGIKKQLWRAMSDEADADAPPKSAILVEETQVPAPVVLRPLAPVHSAAPPAPVQRLSSEADRESSTWEPEPDTLRTEQASSQGLAQSRRGSLGAAARSSSRSPQKPLPRRSASIAPRAGRQHAPPVAAMAQDDPFVDHAPATSPGGPQQVEQKPEHLPLRPSPNSRTSARKGSVSAAQEPLAPLSARDDSPISSPSQRHSLEMPPSAQPNSRSRPSAAPPGSPSPQKRADRSEAKGKLAPPAPGLSDEDDEAEVEPFRRELRFFGALGTPPLSPDAALAKKEVKKEKGKKRASAAVEDEQEAVAAVKTEEPDVGGINDGAIASPRPAKKRRSKQASQLQARASRAAAAAAASKLDTPEPLDSDSLAADPVARLGLDQHYNMPPYPDDKREAQKWLKEYQKRRRLDADQQRAAKKRAAAASGSKRHVEAKPEHGGFYKETVRNKAERQKMLAEPCTECKNYFERAGKPVECKHVEGEPTWTKKYLDQRHEQQDRLQANGRHRVAQPTDKEPPDYWQFGIPSSNEVADINRRAKAQNDERRAYQETEALRANGAFRYRDDGA
ncbi:hypothetical protein Rhopal_001764-T1 [Rhodotorula paludigena]|uniref:DNA endonuclease activator Ctp1 C-terminal domain-containing protein n=1 Tax=Rhodotorula paludigena TaxID=86838 RepID=A0AAV5GE45_9BASI|nr:hypothetical protein Rhopal_001764-T1 [Rhodotorula paludigena]